jgi:CelD/BcsL family acetyltransferase involved in cellulose biosynthesis
MVPLSGTPGQNPPPLDIGVASSDADLSLLEAEWNRLFESADATVFQSYEWATAWWNHFREGRELHCLCFRSGGRLVGLAPLCRRTVRFLGVPLFRSLEFLGRPHADYLDILVAPGFGLPVVEAFVKHIASGRARIDLLDLEEIPPWSLLKDHIGAPAGASGMKAVIDRGPACPYIPLPGTFEEFLSSLGPNTRYNYRRKWTRLQGSHTVNERVVRGNRDEVAAGLRSFMKIHGDRWKGLGFPSAFDNPVERGFFEEMVRRFAGRDWIRIFLIQVDGVDVAASLEFLYGGRAYMYHCNAFGPDDVMRCSPGLLVKLFAIRSDIGEGMCEYDMLRGEESYKYEHLKAAERFNSTLRMAAPPSLSRVRFRVFLVWLLARKAFGRTKLEYYQWRRFTITKSPASGEKLRYLLERLAEVGRMAGRFVGVYFAGSRPARGGPDAQH